MPHGGYHGTIAVNPGTTLAVNPGSALNIGGGQQIVGGQSVLTNQGIQNVGGSAPSTTENIEKQIEDQVKKIKQISQGIGMTEDDDPEFGINRRSQFLATQPGIANLSNLLRQQQEENLRRSILSSAGKGVLNKSDLTGFEGGILGIRTGDFEDVPAATVINPFTGEKIVTGKAREGLTTPQYNEFIANLYDANPELFEEQFPVASGQALKPLIARILEGDLGKLAGNVGSGITSFIDSATGAIFKPRGGTVRPSDVGTPSDTGGVTSVIDAPKLETPLFANVPDQFREGFLDFYNKYEGPKAGGMAITPVRLPDGSVIEFGDTGSARIFREYLESIGVKIDPDTGQDIKQVESQPTGISKFDVDKFYASLPQYTQQGIMSPNLSRFTDALRMFSGMA
jgi:hypothetical protein